jgi:hypothetical protein
VCVCVCVCMCMCVCVYMGGGEGVGEGESVFQRVSSYAESLKPQMLRPFIELMTLGLLLTEVE